MAPVWRLILGSGAARGLEPAAGARNMAVDSALHDSVCRGGGPALRLYRWHPACLSFGRNQHARDIYDAAAIAAVGLDVVRRPTGGLAVLHDRELTYCVTAPLASFGGPRAAYHSINRALVEALHVLGVDARLATAGRRREPRMTAEPCFQAPAEGEVMVAGRKLVGSAQRCERGVLLQHGSILLTDSQARVTSLVRETTVVAAGDAVSGASVALQRAPAVAGPGPAALADVLGAEPATDTLVAAMTQGFERSFGIRLAPATLTNDEVGRAERLVTRYADRDWTWRL